MCASTTGRKNAEARSADTHLAYPIVGLTDHPPDRFHATSRNSGKKQLPRMADCHPRKIPSPSRLNLKEATWFPKSMKRYGPRRSPPRLPTISRERMTFDRPPFKATLCHRPNFPRITATSNLPPIGTSLPHVSCFH